MSTLDSSKLRPVADELSFSSVKVAVIAPRDVPSKFEFEQAAIDVGRLRRRDEGSSRGAMMATLVGGRASLGSFVVERHALSFRQWARLSAELGHDVLLTPLVFIRVPRRLIAARFLRQLSLIRTSILEQSSLTDHDQTMSQIQIGRAHV